MAPPRQVAPEVPDILINEFTTNGSGRHPDTVELYAEKGGNTAALPICKVENLQNALQYLRDSGLRIVAATEHTERNYTEVDMTVPTCIVMGSEEKGIYEENLKLCTDQVRLPMTGVIESLNVSVAAGVFIYEAVRQRNHQS